MSLSAEPKKRFKVKNRILEDIKNGKLVPGARLATVREMCNLFDVSTSVVQNALHELTELGLVECQGVNGFYVKSAPQDKVSAVPSPDAPNGRMHLFAMHHSDLVWRRTYAGYAGVRAEQIRHLLALAEKHPFFCFGFEQAEILRVYIRENPQDHEKLKKLLAEKRLGLYGGFCIPDLNMVNGESILRNLLRGRALYRELFGHEVSIACMNDAFGMCAQLPQILALSGFDALLPGRMNARPSDQASNSPFLWTGLDDTRITVMPPTANITHQGYTFNLPLTRTPEFRITECISLLDSLKERPSMVIYCMEEGLISEQMFPAIEQTNRKCGSKIRFGLAETYLEELNRESLPVFRGEFNPEMTGCYTTRIGLKQRIRRLENALFETAVLSAFAGKVRDLAGEWDELILCQFHDAICGCHTDEAFEDISAKLDYVEKSLLSPFKKEKSSFAVSSFNNMRTPQLIAADRAPAGLPCQKEDGKFYFADILPSCGVKHYAERKDAVPSGKKTASRFSTKYYEVDFSTPHPRILNKEGKNVFRPEFAEILMRRDQGSMWEERIETVYIGAESQEEKIVRVEEGEVFFKVVTEGTFLPAPPPPGNTGNHWPGFESLAFRKEYVFPKELDYFQLKITLDFKGENTKIFVRFPLDLVVPQTVETYEVPFGSIVRRPYYEVKYENAATLFTEDMEYHRKRFKTSSGDWPALNWVNYSDSTYGLTVANTGTPGHQLVNGEVIVSLLRSPTLSRDGGMFPQPGAHDNGSHVFEFAFRAHSPAELEKAYELGILLNRPAKECDPGLADGSYLEWDAPNIALSSLEKTDDGVIVRFYETLGRETLMRASSRFGAVWKAADVSGNDSGPADPSALAFKPFEIRTFRVSACN